MILSFVTDICEAVLGIGQKVVKAVHTILK